MLNSDEAFDHHPDVIVSILQRHRLNGMTDARARRAIIAFVTSLAPDTYLNESDLSSLEVYVDITLQQFKRGPLGGDGACINRIRIIEAIGAGVPAALQTLRAI